MAKVFYKILLVIVAISFFMSAEEINPFNGHDTFFDQYDTYVRTEQISLDFHGFATDVNDIDSMTFYTSAYFLLPGQYEPARTNEPVENIPFYPPKRFLLNAVLRI